MTRQVWQEMHNGIRTIVDQSERGFHWLLLDSNNVVLATGQKPYGRLHEALRYAFRKEQSILALRKLEVD